MEVVFLASCLCLFTPERKHEGRIISEELSALILSQSEMFFF